MNDGRDAITDIVDAVIELNAALMRHGINPPKSIELASRDDYNHLAFIAQRDSLTASAPVGLENATIVGIHLKWATGKPAAD